MRNNLFFANMFFNGSFTLLAQFNVYAWLNEDTGVRIFECIYRFLIVNMYEFVYMYKSLHLYIVFRICFIICLYIGRHRAVFMYIDQYRHHLCVGPVTNNDVQHLQTQVCTFSNEVLWFLQSVRASIRCQFQLKTA